MICQQRSELIAPWRATRFRFLAFLVGVANFLVQQIFEADQKRVATLHQIEYADKMASIGRLAAGVAHEINNPLAIINEKAGLIRDLFIIKKDDANDPKLLAVVESILRSVDRCAKITRRLLSFARHMGPVSGGEPVQLAETIDEVIDRVAEYKRRSSARDMVPGEDSRPNED